MSSKINDAIEEVIRQILAAKSEANKIKIKPNLMNIEESIETFEKFGEEDSIFITTINIPLIHRYIRDYGTKETKEEFRIKINNLYEKKKDFDGFMHKLIEGFGDDGKLMDVDKINEIYEIFLMKINSKNQARSDFHTFLANLKISNFKV
ncbi:hypothetical protein [Janthinobacterium violaceinigrum]|uniref:Uncharacterized protein n=1 Tax=Janthinobacterium violaceinigrum TaxID=2654252 RepID=A0A6I1HXG8_9BURK|nr:hypothetical protein [Janthinobacterium violaceinigrum]KAB8062962.1 hypothetical protein GCN75_20855 [Janthinobacterium violaceinigrum]